MEAQDDPYTILGVDRGASTRELRRARNGLLLHWHPDRTQDPEAADQAARINAAYEVLSDPERRAAYDRGDSTGSLASMLSRVTAGPWSPATSDERRAAAQQRVVDRFKDGPRPVRLPGRRWSDTVAWPASEREVRIRLLWRVLPFAILAVGWLVVSPHFEGRLPSALVPAVPYVAVYAATAGLRGLVGRAATFAGEGWGRFTLSWMVGVAAIVAAQRWLFPHVPTGAAVTLHLVAPAVLLVLAALAVYRITRVVRLPA